MLFVDTFQVVTNMGKVNMNKRSLDRVKQRIRRPCKSRVFCKKKDVNKAVNNIVNMDITNTNNNITTTTNNTRWLLIFKRNSCFYKKIENIESSFTFNVNTTTGYRLIDLEVLSNVFKRVICPECQGQGMTLVEKEKKKHGLSSCLCLECLCGYSLDFYTSRKC